MNRSSHQRCSMKKGVLRNFTKFTGEHLSQGLFFNKNADLSPATLLKKEALAQLFSCEFCAISKSTFFTEHLRWLLPHETIIVRIIISWFCLRMSLTSIPWIHSNKDLPYQCIFYTITLSRLVYLLQMYTCSYNECFSK